jgi:hypothetical protein
LDIASIEMCKAGDNEIAKSLVLHIASDCGAAKRFITSRLFQSIYHPDENRYRIGFSYSFPDK